MVNQQHKNLEKFILSDADLKDEFSSSFLDPGVSNTDVDWLFRGREVKKLSKRSTNTISNEVQSHLLHAQQKALIQSMGNDITSDGSLIDSSINLSSPVSSTASTTVPVSIPLKNDTPLKSSLKSSASSSSLRIDTSVLPNSPSNNATLTGSINSPHDLQSLNSYKSGSSFTPSTPSSYSNNPATAILNNHQLTPSSTPTSASTSTTGTRSRSSSILFGRQKSPSNASETSKPAKKSLLSTLSSKLKSTASPSSPIQAKSSVSSPIVSRSVTPKNAVPIKPIQSPQQLQQSQQQQQLTNKKHKPNVLDNISFKRVCFALDELIEDPQQQIPSRRPKKGNVLIPEDMLAPPPKLSIGITNSFNEQTKDKKPVVDPKLYEQAVARQKFFLNESKKHSEEAHIAALRMAKEVSSFKKRKNSFLRSDDESEEEENITDSRFMSKDDSLDIDTPLHEHVNYFGNDSSSTINPSDELNLEISLETLYTRCCHLREILPIPASLKQLKDKSRPLHVLKMLNPKPTLIDVLSFSDFLSVAPVITVIFDNVTIDTDMLKIILISLKNSKYLDKLSLRNVPIDSEGWKFVCKFLETNKIIQKLDISQQKVKKSNDGNAKSVLRNELDWNLFTETLISRGGIDELIINGCNLTNNDFANLVNKGLVLKTKKLGLASSQLDNQKMQNLLNWISMEDSKCIGVDFAFNNLSLGQIKILNNAIKTNASNINLQFLSLNSTDIELSDCSELIKNLASLKSLRYLDLSNNPHLFPDIIPVLRDNLPKYPDLRRLHFDFDSLTEFSIVQLCLIFQACSKLVHVSILGNQVVTSKIVSALYSAVKNSHIYNIDMDYDGLDEELASRIAFFLMRNMESFLNANSKKSKPNYKSTKSVAGSDTSANTTATTDLTAKDDDLIFDGSLLTKAAEHLLENDLEIVGEERFIIYKSLIEKTIKLRNEIHSAMNRLFETREKGNLSIEGKENLLRFCLLDDSLENIFTIFADEIKLNDDDKNKLLNMHDDISNIDHGARPSMMRNLSSQLVRHHSIDNLAKNNDHDFIEETKITGPSEAPHIVVADADSVPVDSTTGKRVLMRKFSSTSVHAKKLEEEEGELHRWGFFVQQQNDIMPDDSQNSKVILNDTDSDKSAAAKKEEEEKIAKEMERLRIEAEEKERLRVENEANEKRKLKINAIPSGSELRETIMKAKGIESISDLIKKVNKDFSTVEKIYKHVDAKRVPREILPIAESPISENNNVGNNSETNFNSNSEANIANNLNNNSDSAILDDDTLSPTISHNSLSDGEIIGQADEVYERILNNVIRVRSNKNE